MNGSMNHWSLIYRTVHCLSLHSLDISLIGSSSESVFLHFWFLLAVVAAVVDDWMFDVFMHIRKWPVDQLNWTDLKPEWLFFSSGSNCLQMIFFSSFFLYLWTFDNSNSEEPMKKGTKISQYLQYRDQEESFLHNNVYSSVLWCIWHRKQTEKTRTTNKNDRII